MWQPVLLFDFETPQGFVMFASSVSNLWFCTSQRQWRCSCAYGSLLLWQLIITTRPLRWPIPFLRWFSNLEPPRHTWKRYSNVILGNQSRLICCFMVITEENPGSRISSGESRIIFLPERSSIYQYRPEISAIVVKKQSRTRLLFAHPYCTS